MSQQLLFIPPDMPTSNSPPFPNCTYSIIYADPPWQYDDQSKNRGGAARHYPTLSDHDIQNLPVSHIADENSVLFLWATWAKLPAAMTTILAWGFQYKTCAFLWAKRNKKAPSWFMGMGAYTRANTEPCLLAVRGNGLKRKSAKVHQIIEAPIGRHSAKPKETGDRIIQLFGDQPRIELFAREKVEGWDAWGNEI